MEDMTTISPCIVSLLDDGYVLWGRPGFIGCANLAAGWDTDVAGVYDRYIELAESTDLDFQMGNSVTLGEAASCSLARLGYPTQIGAVVNVAVVLIVDGHLICPVPQEKTIAQLLEVFPHAETIYIGLNACETAGSVLVGKYLGYHFSIHPEGNPRHHKPHVHANYDNDGCYTGTFDINTGELLSKGFQRGKQLNMIKKIILENKDELLECWNHYNEGFPVDANVEIGACGLDMRPCHRQKARSTADALPWRNGY